jgi:hypothetical protein
MEQTKQYSDCEVTTPTCCALHEGAYRLLKAAKLAAFELKPGFPRDMLQSAIDVAEGRG